MDLKKNAPKGEFLAYINKEEAAMLKKAGGSGKLVNGIPSFRPQDYGQEARAKTARAEGKPTADSNPYAGAGQGSKSDPTVKDDGRGYTTETQDYNTYLATGENPLDLDITRLREDGPTLTPKEIKKKEIQNSFYNNKPKYPSYIPSYIKTAANFNRKPNRKYFYDKVLKNNAANLNYTDLEKAYEEYMDNRMAGYTDAMGNVSPNYRLEGNRYVQNDQGGSNQDIISNFQSPIIEEEVEVEEDTGPEYRFGTEQDVIYDNYGTAGYRTTRAEGGIMGTRARRAMGGIMNRIDQRQGFFLGGIGKAIGKVGKAAGKVLSSDIGKMAIAGAAFYYGGGGTFAPGGASTFSPGNFFTRSNPLLFNKAKELSLGKLFGISTVLPYIFGDAKPNKTSFSDRGGQLIDPISGKPNDMAGMRENIELAKLEAGDDADKLAAIDAKYNNMLNLQYQANLPDATPYVGYGKPGYRTTAAEGGRIGKAEGGLLDLGGMEKDYRNDGGFVPIGEYEKKDDVPARLSVNEFVMTADAVRGAGQGDIDKGAEIMENMMKNLENGGTVSEQSQGNKGAQQMFETSERIGEVI